MLVVPALAGAYSRGGREAAATGAYARVESPAPAVRVLVSSRVERPAKKHVARRARKARARHAPRPGAREAKRPTRRKPRVRPVQPLPTRPAGARVSVSLYETTTRPAILHEQGCRAGARDVGGLTILDFGKPAWSRHGYGTVLFSNRPTANHRITRGLLSFAAGYVRCLPRGSERRIVLARGTSNYHMKVPSAFAAGRAWARATMRLSRLIERHPRIAAHVRSAAAIDAEPAWDRRFRKTRDFYRGYRSVRSGHVLYNFGSLDGGVGSIWNAKQAAFVTAGRDTRVVPEIYSREMAHQWARLTKIALRDYRRPVRFAGVMTQHRARCGCSLKPKEARQALVRALAVHVGETAPAVPPTLTNIKFR